jgi:DNA-directed RNA polymerase specialized sigma24 family protein
MNKVDEILRQYPYIAEDIQQEQSKLNQFIKLRCEAQEKASNPLKAQAITGMPHGHDINDQTYQAVEKIMDSYQDEINACIHRINELIELKKWLDKAFAGLTEDERRILYLKYDEHWQVWKIMQRMGIMERKTFYKTIDRAKEKIKKVMFT